MQEFKRAGLRIPEDVSVAGVDNVAFSAHLEPPLTTLDTNLKEVGRLAVILLLDRVEGRYSGPPRHVAIRDSFVIRASCCAPPRQNNVNVSNVRDSRGASVIGK
jgi:LacI family repressor for deo operon, udp, cdd, tsx, nupC, and nupG